MVSLTISPITNSKLRLKKQALCRFKMKTFGAKYKIQNTKYKIQNTKYKIQNTKYKIQNTKYKKCIGEVKIGPVLISKTKF